MCTLHIKEILMPHIPRLAHQALGCCLLLGFAWPATAAPPAGQLLASNCFQCHGTNGQGPGFERLAGKTAREIYTKMKELQRENDAGNLMARHAHGYTDEQLTQLSAWLSTQH
jgi:cytochrome subunit of sulfide dehydrogenase